MATLWVLLVLLGLFALLVLLLLFVPFAIRLRVESDVAAEGWEGALAGRADWRYRLRWGLLPLSGGVTWRDGDLVWSEVRLLGLRLGGGRRSEDAGPPSARERREKPRSRPRRRGLPDPDLLLALAGEMARVPGQLWRSLGLRLAAELTYGFSDPSLTGLCEAVRWGTGLGQSLRLTPDFQRPCAKGWAELSGRLYGFRLLAIAWRVLRRREIWNHLVGRIRFRPLRQILIQGGS